MSIALETLRRLLLAAAIFGLPPTVLASSFVVGIDTSLLAGQSGYIAIDLYQGDPASTNEVVVSSFSTGATLGAPTLIGDVVGDLQTSVTLRSTAFFSGILQPLTFAPGETLFELDVTQNHAPGAAPDSLAVFLLDAAQIPFATTDPTGAGALLVIDLLASPVPQLYASDVALVRIVPEPRSAWLFLIGLPLAWSRAGRLARQSRCAAG